MADPYKGMPGVSDPANNLVTINLDDFNNMTWGLKSLRIVNDQESWATVKVLTMHDNIVTLDIPPNCVWIEPLRVKRVFESDTTAGLGIAGYTDILTGDEVKPDENPE